MSHSSKDKDRLALFQEATKAITSTLQAEEALQLIVRKLSDLIGADAATIRLVDQENSKLIFAASHGLSDEYLQRGPIDDEDVVEQALSGTPTVIEDAGADADSPYAEEARKEGVKTILTAPIVFRGRTIGVLRLLSKSHHSYDDDDIAFIAALAEQCGVAIENARIYQEQQRRLDYFNALHEIGKTINSTWELRTALDFIAGKLPEVMSLKGCTIRLLESDEGRLELMASSGLSDEYLSRGSIDDEIGTHMALRGEPAVIVDAQNDPRNHYRQAARKEGIKSILAAPIIVRDKIIGVLRLLTSEHREFGEIDISFALAVAEHGGIAIQNARSFNKIQKLIHELEQHEDFLQHVIDGMGAELMVLDKDLRTTMVNKAFLDNRDLVEAEVIGKPFADFATQEAAQRIHPGVLAEKNEPALHLFDECDGKDGRRLEMMASPAWMFDDGPKPDVVIVTMYDVTDRIRLQNERLAAEKLRGVLEMAGAVSHEINSPLFTAVGTAELLIEDLADESAAEELRLIIRNLKLITDLTKKITRITRYEAKAYAGGVNIVDIAKACEDS